MADSEVANVKQESVSWDSIEIKVEVDEVVTAGFTDRRLSPHPSDNIENQAMCFPWEPLSKQKCEIIETTRGSSCDSEESTIAGHNHPYTIKTDNYVSAHICHQNIHPKDNDNSTREYDFNSPVFHNTSDLSNMCNRDLKVQSETHNIEKPYSCDASLNKGSINSRSRNITVSNTSTKQCSSNTFNSELTHTDMLNAHLRTEEHSGSHFCLVCGRAFAKKSYLQSHLKCHTGEKPYICHICQKAYHEKRTLNKHLKSHTGEKPYICDVCKKAFNAKHVLILHLKSHTGEKPYSCDVCRSQFWRKVNLEVHIRTHTGEKPYSCELCKLVYK